MRRITNTEEANHYYSKVNELVDEYISKWKVRPSEIRSYFKRNMKSFLERVGLSDVEGIDRVLNDVLDHKYHMELDSVLKFESFINESVLSIGKTNLNHEKFVADYYDTSMGHVECVDEDMHIFRVTEIKKRVNCIVFSEEEITEITNRVKILLIEESKNKYINIKEVGGVKLEVPIKMTLNNFWSEDAFLKEVGKVLDKSSVIYLIKSLVGKSDSVLSAERITYKSNEKGFYIWEIK